MTTPLTVADSKRVTANARRQRLAQESNVPTSTEETTQSSEVEVPAVIRDAQPKFYLVMSQKLKKQVWIRPCPKCNATGSIRSTFRKTGDVQLKKCFACAIPGRPELNAGKGYQTVGDYERCKRYDAHRFESQTQFAGNVKSSLLSMGIPAEAFRAPVAADREQPPIESYDEQAF